MDPKKNKEESLNLDRRNTYGENSKSSRKSIRRRKQWVNKAYRRSVRQALLVPGAEQVEDLVANTRRHDWKKCADKPLGNVLRNNLIREIEALVREQSKGAVLLDRLEQCLIVEGWAPPGVRVIMRQLRSMAFAPWSCELDLDLPAVRKLLTILREVAS